MRMIRKAFEAERNDEIRDVQKKSETKEVETMHENMKMKKNPINFKKMHVIILSLWDRFLPSRLFLS